MKSILSNIKQLLFSRKNNIDDIISNSSVACVNLIKCMEFYTDKGCDADLDHWISVATTEYDKFIGEKKIAGGHLIFQGLSKDFIDKYFDKNRVKDCNFSSQLLAIQSFKNTIEKAKANGIPKYLSLLEKDKTGRIKWKYSNKYYKTFFEVLGYLLNSQISLYDLCGIGIDPETGKIWGGRIIPEKEPKGVLELGWSRYDFQDLIYKYIYLMNYEQLNGNKELAKRISKGI